MDGDTGYVVTYIRLHRRNLSASAIASDQAKDEDCSNRTPVQALVKAGCLKRLPKEASIFIFFGSNASNEYMQARQPYEM